jgi:hypothetical protein
MTEVQGCTVVSFVQGYSKTQPMSKLLSICVVFCMVVHMMKQVISQKSGKTELARIHRRCVLCQELIFELESQFLTQFVKYKLAKNMQGDLLTCHFFYHG